MYLSALNAISTLVLVATEPFSSILLSLIEAYTNPSQLNCMQSENDKRGSSKALARYMNPTLNAVNKSLDRNHSGSGLVDNNEALDLNLLKFSDIVQQLANGPSIGIDIWFPQIIRLLFDSLGTRQSSALDNIIAAYVACAKLLEHHEHDISNHIQTTTLFAVLGNDVPYEHARPSIKNNILLVLYRLTALNGGVMASSICLMYSFPLLVTILQEGGLGVSDKEERDEQVTLALGIVHDQAQLFSHASFSLDILLSLLPTFRNPSVFRNASATFLSLSEEISKSSISEQLVEFFDHILLNWNDAARPVFLNGLESFDLRGQTFMPSLLLCAQDDDENIAVLATALMHSNNMHTRKVNAIELLEFAGSLNEYPRDKMGQAVATLCRESKEQVPAVVDEIIHQYREKAQTLVPIYDKLGLLVASVADQKDPFPHRESLAKCLIEIVDCLSTREAVKLLHFYVSDGPLGDRNSTVAAMMLAAGQALIEAFQNTILNQIFDILNQFLASPARGTDDDDRARENSVVLLGVAAQFLDADDARRERVSKQLFDTLRVPSEAIQYAVCKCISKLFQTIGSVDVIKQQVSSLMVEVLTSQKYAIRRGSSYGIAGIVHGCGIQLLHSQNILEQLCAALLQKKDAISRQGALSAVECLMFTLNRVFEPYLKAILPGLLASFGDTKVDVRAAAQDTTRVIMSKISGLGVKMIFDTLLSGLEDDQWRSKRASIDMLGSMAYCAPAQLSNLLPTIIPKLTEILKDSHAQIVASANQSLLKFGEVIDNPEIQNLAPKLLQAISEPNRHTDSALVSLLKTSFSHYLDGPSLALIMPILDRGLKERNAITKRNSCRIVVSLGNLVNPADIIPYLDILMKNLTTVLSDPVPDTRATAAKAIGSLVDRLGEDHFPHLINEFLEKIKSPTAGVERLGAAQALAEVLSSLGLEKMELILPIVLKNTRQADAEVREGFMMMLVFLPAVFEARFLPYLDRTIPTILEGLADVTEQVRQASIAATSNIISIFGVKSLDLLLPELLRRLFDENWRMRQSAVELLGGLIYKIVGLPPRFEPNEAPPIIQESQKQELNNVVGLNRMESTLSAIYILRNDSVGSVRVAASHIWNSLVSNTARMIQHLLPEMSQHIVDSLANSGGERRRLAGKTLGDLAQKLGSALFSKLLPILKQILLTGSADRKLGACIGLKEALISMNNDQLRLSQEEICNCVEKALIQDEDTVRQSAAELFCILTERFDASATNSIIPNLLISLENGDQASSALKAIQEITYLKAETIVPFVISSFTTIPIGQKQSLILSSIAEVSCYSLNRWLSRIVQSLLESIDLLETNHKDSRYLRSTFVDVIVHAVDADGFGIVVSSLLNIIQARNSVSVVALSEIPSYFPQIGPSLNRSSFNAEWVSTLISIFAHADDALVSTAVKSMENFCKALRKEDLEASITPLQKALVLLPSPSSVKGFSKSGGLNSVLPIILQALLYGSFERRETAAICMSIVVNLTSGEGLRPFSTQIVGPLIRTVGERHPPPVKAAILQALNSVLLKIPQSLKPFTPQLTRTFSKCLADTAMAVRYEALQALKTLIPMQPRMDPLIVELVQGGRHQDLQIRSTMLHAMVTVTQQSSKLSDNSQSSIFQMFEANLKSEKGL